MQPEATDPIARHDLDLEARQAQGNFAFAQAAGIAAGVGMAVLWGLITYFTHFVIGYFAIAVGIAVGVAMKAAGKGTGKAYGIMSGAYALLGCMLGNLMCIAFAYADQAGLSLFTILFKVDYGVLFSAYLSEFDVRDILFYAIAFSSAYKIALNPAKKDELDYVLEAKAAEKAP